MLPPPKTPTFGDLKPAPATMPKPKKADDKPRRQLKPGCTFPEIKTFKQTGGPLYLTLFKYNGCTIYGIGDDQVSATDEAQQFYMRETAKGRAESEEV